MNDNRYAAATLAARLISDGRTLDDVIGELRDNGCQKIRCITALVDAGHMSLVEAKKAVHESPAWADVKQRDEAFWDSLEADLD